VHFYTFTLPLSTLNHFSINRTEVDTTTMIASPIATLTKTEWRIWLPLAVLAFVGASLLMSGWPKGLIPELLTPYSYAGDGMAYLWNIQRAIEGTWYFTNNRSGFPFGSNHLDYPTSDTGNYLVIKLLGAIFKTAVATHNLYYLLGFSLAAIAAYLVSRSIGITRYFAIAVALIYAFTSFHFGRIGHLFFTWYFVAPLFFYVGFRLFSEKLVFTNAQISLKAKVFNVLALIALASFGIYYAFFGCIVIVLCTGMATALNRSWKHLREGLLMLSITFLGVLLNVLPSLIHIFQNGENREGVNRYASETELYALKITQLLLPRGDHRLDSFFEFASKYNGFFPNVTENISASMGAVASTGFLILVVVSLVSPFLSSKPNDIVPADQTSSAMMRFNLLAALSLGLVLMGTMGGFSSPFAMLISSSIRAWNRISIFITFISVVALVMAIDWLVNKYSNHRFKKFVGIALAFVIVVVGILDQTVKPCHSCLLANDQLAKNDQAFMQAIEKSVPKDSAIYQLPYIPYSDGGQVNGVGSYDHARGHLFSEKLKWSFGSMRGRDGDWFFRKLAQLPLSEQVSVVTAMGFSGIYIDRRGFIDASPTNDKKCSAYAASQVARLKNNCITNAELEQSITKAIDTSTNQQKLVSKDNQLTFFPLKSYVQNQEELTKANTYIRAIGYQLINSVPVQLEGGFDEPIDLRKDDPDFPAYLGNVTGLSGVSILNEERIGRWSNALFAKRVTLWLAKPLPKKFRLQIRAQAAGLNAGKPMQIKIGKQTKDIIFSSEFETKSISFEIDEPVYKIEFKPADPFSPARRWGYGDTGLIAVLFQQIQIIPN
jgi:phosphoglycerol transferase